MTSCRLHLLAELLHLLQEVGIIDQALHLCSWGVGWLVQVYEGARYVWYVRSEDRGRCLVV